MTKEISPPKTWVQFASGLHQDFDILYSDMSAYIQEFCSQISLKEKTELKAFILQVLEQGVSGGSHKNIFRRYGSQFVPKKPEALFNELLDAVERK